MRCRINVICPPGYFLFILIRVLFFLIYCNFRFLFWTDTGDAGVPKIERSDLSGGSRELLVKRSLYNPTSIVLDISEQRIYWTDSVRDTIETATYNGGDRRLIRRLVSTNLYDIALYKVIDTFVSL